MSSWREFGTDSTHLPSVALDEETRAARDLPRTLRPVVGDDVRQRAVFDPSLRHNFRGYRAGDPVFDAPERTAAWLRARRAAMDAVLSAVAESAWAGSLVLRGSALMADRFGEAAREPGDLDFVVVPETWRMEDGRTDRMLDGIAAAADGRAGIKASGAVSEEIWTYDRVPGRRMVLPWSVPGLPDGQVQLDFVFTERLPVAPEPAELACGAVLLAATPELSLAWKVLWLISDRHPQGKDLYDAVLLAERHRLPNGLLQEVFRQAGEAPQPHRDVELLDIVHIAPEGYVGAEWQHFEAEYPHLAAPGEEAFLARLVEALRPTFESPAPDTGPDAGTARAGVGGTA
ncbi:nucleotidyl transferase AbiEii/AbiGii toxin family protein [Streptomyces sp. NPDC047023]|uniref:nucleotidyl transferase AbiEii/AbiGii toxin family protein n=1 Tax=Streptomyces sp. NPDC047023 TaxID=3155139 RepID=UPI0033C0A9A4